MPLFPVDSLAGPSCDLDGGDVEAGALQEAEDILDVPVARAVVPTVGEKLAEPPCTLLVGHEDPCHLDAPPREEAAVVEPRGVRPLRGRVQHPPLEDEDPAVGPRVEGRARVCVSERGVGLFRLGGGDPERVAVRLGLRSAVVDRVSLEQRARAHLELVVRLVQPAPEVAHGLAEQVPRLEGKYTRNQRAEMRLLRGGHQECVAGGSGPGSKTGDFSHIGAAGPALRARIEGRACSPAPRTLCEDTTGEEQRKRNR